jgi:protein TonB
MNILGNNAAKLNEVVFENRNKNYGAYAIRSEYNESLRKSLLYVSGFVLLLFVTMLAYNKYNTQTEDEKVILVDDLKPEIFDFITEVNLMPITEQPVENVVAASAAPEGGIATHIIDNAVETGSVNLNNQQNGQGPADATGASLTSSVVTTNTVTTEAPTNTIVASSTVLVFAEEMPEFEGGVAGIMRYVGQNISYPEGAKVVGKEGTVYVSFVVNEVGNVENVKVMKGIGYGCDEEVVRVITKMPRWKKVGKNNGQPVKVRFNIPVAFRLK